MIGTRAPLVFVVTGYLADLKPLYRDALMEEYVRLMQNMLRSTSTIKKRAKSVYQSKNLGTIKNRKQQKQQTTKEDSNGEIILRILRMRYFSLTLKIRQLDSFYRIGAGLPTSSFSSCGLSIVFTQNRKRGRRLRDRGR